MTRVIIARPPPRHARRADGQRLRLDDAARPTPRARSSAARRALEPRPADRRGGPRSRRRRREPRLRAARPRLRGRVRGAAADDPQRAQPASGRATSSRTTRRLHRQLPARGLGRAGAPRTRSSSWATTTGSAARRPPARSTPLSGPGYDLADTVRAYTARVPVAADPRHPVVRPGVVDGDRRAALEQTLERREVRLQPRGELRERHRTTCASTAGAGTRSSRARTSPTAARTAPRPTAASPAGGRSGTTTRRR